MAPRTTRRVNRTDLTLRNLHAQRRITAALAGRILQLEVAVKKLQAQVKLLAQLQ